jgi:cadmium resistance protein CadD (predicted permease)
VALSRIGQAAGMFTVTNIDDMLILAVFFGQAAGQKAAAWRIVAGQYLRILGILAASVLGALVNGTTATTTNRARLARATGRGLLAVAAVTFANGGDNIGVYVPVFTVSGIGGMSIYVTVFLIGVAIWCGAGWFWQPGRWSPRP